MTKEEFDKELDSCIPEFSKKASLCFLNKIYSRNNADDVYELAILDDRFRNVLLYRTCNLHAICSFGYTTDFSLDGDYVLCNPQVRTVPGDSLTDIDTVFGMQPEKSLFSFIAEGSDNDFILLDDTVVKAPDNVITKGFTYFNNIRFSMSTMSVYAPIFVEDGFYNKILSTEISQKLEVKPFYFAAKDNHGYGEFISTKEINNDVYNVYYVDFLPIFDQSVSILSAPVINYAVQLIERCNFAISALTDYLHDYYSVDNESPAWVGGDRNYTSNFSVLFKSTYEKLTKRQRAYIFDALKQDLPPIYADDERVQFLKNVITVIKRMSDGESDDNELSLSAVSTLLISLKHYRIWYSSYLMAVRYFMFCSHAHIDSISSANVIYGGMTDYGTVVEEGF